MEADLRQLFEERFKHIIEQINKLDVKTEKLNDKIDSIILSDKDKCDNCPNSKRIETIETQTQDLGFFLRNPKIGIAIIAFSTVLMIIAMSDKLPGVIKVSERLEKFEYHYRHPDELINFRGGNLTMKDSTITKN